MKSQTILPYKILVKIMGTTVSDKWQEKFDAKMRLAQELSSKYPDIKICVEPHSWGKDFKYGPGLDFFAVPADENCLECKTPMFRSMKKLIAWLDKGCRPEMTKTKEQDAMEKTLVRQKAIESSNEVVKAAVGCPDGRVFIWTTGRNAYLKPGAYRMPDPNVNPDHMTLQQYMNREEVDSVTDMDYPPEVYKK